MTTPSKDQELTPLQQRIVARKLIEAEIISRAWANEDFRKKLEENPSEALAKAGLPIPKNKTIQVVPEAVDTLTLVIPPAPSDSEEIGEAELEAVAGGGLYFGSGTCQAYEDFYDEMEYGDDPGQVRALAIAAFGSYIGKSWLWG